MRFVPGRPVALAALAAALLAFAAGSAANGVKSGEIRLKPNQSTFEGFADMAIAVESKGDATFSGGAFVFPANGGNVDPDSGYQGLIGGSGALKFSRESDGAKLKFKNIQVVIRKSKADLSGTVGRDATFVKLARVDGYGILTDGNSFALKMGDTTLSRAGAEVLSDTFDFPFRRGIPLGKLAVEAKITKGQVAE